MTLLKFYIMTLFEFCDLTFRTLDDLILLKFCDMTFRRFDDMTLFGSYKTFMIVYGKFLCYMTLDRFIYWTLP